MLQKVVKGCLSESQATAGLELKIFHHEKGVVECEEKNLHIPAA